MPLDVQLVGGWGEWETPLHIPALTGFKGYKHMGFDGLGVKNSDD